MNASKSRFIDGKLTEPTHWICNEHKMYVKWNFIYEYWRSRLTTNELSDLFADLEDHRICEWNMFILIFAFIFGFSPRHTLIVYRCGVIDACGFSELSLMSWNMYTTWKMFSNHGRIQCFFHLPKWCLTEVANRFWLIYYLSSMPMDSIRGAFVINLPPRTTQINPSQSSNNTIWLFLSVSVFSVRCVLTLMV